MSSVREHVLLFIYLCIYNTYVAYVFGFSFFFLYIIQFITTMVCPCNICKKERQDYHNYGLMFYLMHKILEKMDKNSKTIYSRKKYLICPIKYIKHYKFIEYEKHHIKYKYDSKEQKTWLKNTIFKCKMLKVLDNANLYSAISIYLKLHRENYNLYRKYKNLHT